MPKIYKAPKPKYTSWSWFKFIALRFVPLVLLWDLAKLIMNRLLGEWVGSIVLLAQGDFNEEKINDIDVKSHNDDELYCEKYKVITHDEAHLDTFEIKHESQVRLAPKYQKYIINMVGNGMCYEQILDDMKNDAKTLQSNVIGFNFRMVAGSVDESKKEKIRVKSQAELIIDGIAQVQRLLHEGVSPENITLKGHSLGAAVASKVAEHFHNLKQPINIFNGRSFSSITNFVVGLIRLKKDLGHKESLGGIILGFLAKPFIKIAVALVDWEIDAGSAFKNIPKAFRDYVVVRSRKEIRDKHYDDRVIKHYASIHKVLSSERHAEKARIDKGIKNLDDMIEKDSPIAKHDLEKAKEALVEARKKIKSDRKMETIKYPTDGHVVSLDLLKNRSNKNANTFFREFVQRASIDHGVKPLDSVCL